MVRLLPREGHISKLSMSGTFKFHHVGVAVPDLEQASMFYSTVLGFKVVSTPVEDPIQRVKVCFLAEAGRSLAHLELISPMDGESPVNGYLTREIGAYHVCYELAEIATALAELRAKRCLVISRPVPGAPFAGRKIA